MEFRAGTPADAEAVAALIASFQRELTDDPSGVGAERYLESVSVEAERGYLSSSRYKYILVWVEARVVAFIAIRDGSHIFHLFVERALHRQGVARLLWERALRELCAPNHEGTFTVNSSLPAVPVYQAFGFAQAGSQQRVHGISFLPMRRAALLA